MFCSKCGAKVNDGDVFCQNCGEKVPQNDSQKMAAMPTQDMQKRKYRLVGISAVAVIAVVVILVVVKIVGAFNGGYEKVIQKFIRAIQEEDGELLCSIYPPDYIDYMTGPGSFYSDEEELAEEFTEECEDRHDDLSYGVEDHPDICYFIENEEKLDEEELESLNYDLERNYDFEKGSVKEAYNVTFNVYIPGGKTYRLERCMMKIHGKWYMRRGI